MTATITDLFCGAGGSSLGAEAAGFRPRQHHAAANYSTLLVCRKARRTS